MIAKMLATNHNFSMGHYPPVIYRAFVYVATFHCVTQLHCIWAKMTADIIPRYRLLEDLLCGLSGYDYQR